ncbi:MAG: TonB-dependent receptor [Kordiimonas sp.]
MKYNMAGYAGAATGVIMSVALNPAGAIALDNDEGMVFEEIMVTARKRDERLQDVPVSIAAITGPKLEQNGIENATDLYGSVPSLYFSSNTLSPGRDFQFLTIRGVGANSQLEPSTGTYIDGVYMPSLGFDLDFLDLARVEVLRGPQGTLFGRNAQGGALNIVTAKPAREFGGKVRVELDEFNSVNLSSSVDVPVSDDTLYLNFATQFSYTDGYIENTTLNTDADDWRKFAGRFSALYLPSDSVEVTFRLDGVSGKGHSAVPGVEAGCECYSVSSEFQEDQKVTNWGGSLHIVVDLDGMELTAITGYRDMQNIMPFDFDSSNTYVDNRHDLVTEQKILSQEIRLASTGDSSFSWLAGLYGYDESLLSDRRYSLLDLDTFFDDILNRQTVETDRKGWAVFGQATYTIADFIDITGGLRYSREKVENVSDVEFSVAPIGFFGAFLSEGKDTFSDVSPMGSIAFRWSEDVMTYFTVAKGFKGGGFDKAPAASQNVRAVDEETSINYEAGLKASLLDKKLIVDASVYKINIKGQQLQTVVLIDGVPFSAIDNAGESHSQGFELSLNTRLTENFTFTANAGYTDAEFDTYVDGSGVDRAGESFPYVPEWTVSMAAEYTTQVGDDLDLTLRGSYRYVDNYVIGSGAAFDPQFNINSYDIFDAQITLSKDNWDLSLFAENLFDSYITTNRWNAFFFAGDSVHRDTIMSPRRVGVRAAFRF